MNLPSPIPKSIFQKDFAVSPSLEPYFILQILGRLKKSLSKALDQFYYLSGRKIDNLYIGSYDKGVRMLKPG